MKTQTYILKDIRSCEESVWTKPKRSKE